MDLKILIIHKIAIIFFETAKVPDRWRCQIFLVSVRAITNFSSALWCQICEYSLANVQDPVL